MAYKITDEQVLKELYKYTMKRAPYELTMNYVNSQYGIWYLNYEKTITAYWDLRGEIAERFNLSKATVLNAFKRLAKKGIIIEDFSNGMTYRYALCEPVISQVNIKTIELLKASGLSEEPKKLTIDEITNIWDEATNALINFVSFNYVLEMSNKKD